jgi:hypothetical protein
MNPLSKTGARIVSEGTAASVGEIAALLLKWRA